MRPVFEWQIGSRTLQLGKRTLIMGIVNVTPDSFFDGGLHLDAGQAIEHAGRLLEEGADILDIGGESTRPGTRVAVGFAGERAEARTPSAMPATSKPAKAPPVSAEEEMKRVLPVMAALKKKYPGAVLSVDTYKASVARAAVSAGAEIV